jgi:hypothetical protein
MPTAPLPPLLSESVAEFIQSGLSITVAACGERLVPSIAKAVACRVDEARREVRLLLFAERSAAVCRDVASNGQVAVCFTRPSNHQTVQLKGSDAVTALSTPLDVASARQSLDRLIEDLLPFGFARRMLDSFFWGETADLLAIRFTPHAAFAQTPGPAAGTAIKG